MSGLSFNPHTHPACRTIGFSAIGVIDKNGSVTGRYSRTILDVLDYTLMGAELRATHRNTYDKRDADPLQAGVLRASSWTVRRGLHRLHRRPTNSPNEVVAMTSHNAGADAADVRGSFFLRHILSAYLSADQKTQITLDSVLGRWLDDPSHRDIFCDWVSAGEFLESESVVIGRWAVAATLDVRPQIEREG